MRSSFFKQLVHPDMRRFLRLYRKAERMDEEELSTLRLFRLQKLVSFYYEKFAFYRKACEEVGFAPEELKELSDLSRLPVMDKNVLRAAEKELAAACPKGSVRRSTSGSTGENFHFYLSKTAQSTHSAFVEYCTARLDLARAKTVGIWGGNLKKPEDNGFLQKIKLTLLHTELLPGYGMDRDTAVSYLEHIRREKPGFVYGYPSYLAFLARAGLESGVPAPTGFRLVASGEQMSPQDREVIESYFGIRVLNRYGSCEFSTIAHEFADLEGFYVNPVQFLLETNEKDELLVTDLWNTATPFLRYNIGDRAALSHDSGRTVITELYGRQNDVIYTPSGKMIPSQFWTILSRLVEDVESFQVVQKSDTELVMRTKSREDFDPEPILVNFDKNFGDEMTLTVTRTEAFESTKMGKHKFVIRKENR